jgi:nicotinamide-nucleotide amidase
MKACIISIGNELLNGQTVNTNASWLSGELFRMGIPTVGGWIVVDRQDSIVDALSQAAVQGDLILVTGGLGPTDDDLTRESVAAFLGQPLQFHQSLLDQLTAFFEKRGKSMAPKNRSQAYIPSGCQILENPAGTAAGFWATRQGAQIVIMPGVPSELKLMFTRQVAPRLEKIRTGPVVVSAKLRCFGAGESDIAQKLGSLMHRDRNPLINCTCGSGDIVLHMVATAADHQTAAKMLQADKAVLQDRLDDLVYGQDDDDLPQVVARLLKKNGKKIAFAESCSGGLLSKLLTDIPGASAYFLAGWVTYSNEAKTTLLNVPADLIREKGAVSEPVALSMAENAAKISGAHVAVAITGIAGPKGGTSEKPAGLVYIAVSVDGNCLVRQFRFPSTSRAGVRLRAALAALNQVRLRLQV